MGRRRIKSYYKNKKLFGIRKCKNNLTLMLNLWGKHARYSGIGCVLYNGIKHTICFYSRSLQSYVKNYSVGALEALTIVPEVKKLRQYAVATCCNLFAVSTCSISLL